MRQLFDEIARRCEAGERVAVCTVVAAHGSTPQAAGARMLLLSDGKTIGTLGGGCVEAEARQRAIGLLLAGESKLLTFQLDHDYGWDDGLICGGTMDIFVETLTHPLAAKHYREGVKAIDSGKPAAIEIHFESPKGKAKFADIIEPPAKLLIVGAGHVGQSLAALASSVDFHVSVIDDRADCASIERFPSAKVRLVGEIEQELRQYPIDAQTFIVIVTRGHRHDGRALAAVIHSSARYIGLIGSRRKVLTIFRDLKEQGVTIEQLLRVHAPIGLELGAVTVPEIAISILAELVAVRRGRDDQSARPMKFDSQQLLKLLETKDG